MKKKTRNSASQALTPNLKRSKNCPPKTRQQLVEELADIAVENPETAAVAMKLVKALDPGEVEDE